MEVLKRETEGNDYSLVDAIMKYYQYLGGTHQHAHKREKVGDDYKKECFRYCKLFADIVKKKKDTTRHSFKLLLKKKFPLFMFELKVITIPRLLTKRWPL